MIDVNNRREECEPGAFIQHPVYQCGYTVVYTAFQCKSGEVQHRINCRQDDQVPGQHRTEAGKTIEKQHSECRAGKPDQVTLHADSGTACQEGSHQHRQELAHQQRNQPGQVKGQEHALPPNRQHVHQGVAAAVIEISEEHHHCQHSDDNGSLCLVDAKRHDTAVQIPCQPSDILNPGIHPNVTQDTDRQCDDQIYQIRRPQRPAAPQRILCNCYIKGQTIRFHVLSLPVHR